MLNSRLENEGEDTNYESFVEDLGIWALSLDRDVRRRMRVSVPYSLKLPHAIDTYHLVLTKT